MMTPAEFDRLFPNAAPGARKAHVAAYNAWQARRRPCLQGQEVAEMDLRGKWNFVVGEQIVSKSPKRIRQSSKPLLNKLETRYLAYLESVLPNALIRAQAKRYMLGNGIWYKPDFTAVIDDKEYAWEVKGPHAFRGGFENLKVAAHQYPEIIWTLAWYENDSWFAQRINP